MAVEVDPRRFTFEQLKCIETHLHFVPELPKWIAPDRAAPQTVAVQFYSVHSQTALRLPFTYARGIMGTHLNTERSYPSVSLPFTGEPFGHQTPVLEEALTILQRNFALLAALHTGWGKTFLAAYLASKLGLVCCVLYHREKIGEGWIKTFREYCATEPFIVGESPLSALPSAKVIVCMNTRVDKLPDKNRVGFLIVDEAHCFCTPLAPKTILSFTPRYLLLETATPEKENGMSRMLDALVGYNKITVLSTKPFQVYRILTGITLDIKKRRWQQREVIDWADYQKQYSTSDYRNQLICELVNRSPGHKILLLTDRYDHAVLLHSLLKAVGENVAIIAGAIKNYNDSRVLVGTTSKIGTGFDEKNACPDFNGVRIDLCILCSSIKSVTKLEQCVGRAFRSDEPIIYHLVDGHKLSQRHWYESVKWYRSRNGTIHDIRLESSQGTYLKAESLKVPDVAQ